MLRTHTCGELNKDYIDKEVTLSGWVSTRRDHGGLIFIDLRDRYGITQLVFNPEKNKELHKSAEGLRDEYVIQVKGIVKFRPEDTQNKKISTGDIEVIVEELNMLNSSLPPVFEVSDEAVLSEDVRYRYRYLDLRRPKLQKNLILRHSVCKLMREYLDTRDFVDIETPILTKSTPEGARDYLVPSRLNIGKFFALPQSPQLFKQILMVSGFDRYYQIAKCFRDEDLRADRQPEFTQLDIEMSFVEEKDIFVLMEGLMSRIFKEIIGYDLKTPFDLMTHKESMERYGTDKPDRRFGLELVDLTTLLRESGFKIFSQAVKDGGIIKGLNLKQPKQMSRSRIDSLNDFVKEQGMGGLSYFKVEKGAVLSGPIVKFFNEDEQSKIIEAMSAEDNDLILIVAGKRSLSNETLARLRNKLGREEGLIKKNKFDFLWVTEFPLFHFNADENRWEAEHHPFTAPFEKDARYFDTGELDKIRSRSYDLVVNGIEIGSGSIRIHRQDIQRKIFDAIGITPEEADLKFSFLIEALSYGAPPHGGIAPGLDRLTALLAGCDSIREVIAFPKTQKAICSMTKAPSAVSELQLKELGLEIRGDVL